jgi:hypothetical protein
MDRYENKKSRVAITISMPRIYQKNMKPSNNPVSQVPLTLFSLDMQAQSPYSFFLKIKILIISSTTLGRSSSQC